MFLCSVGRETMFKGVILRIKSLVFWVLTLRLSLCLEGWLSLPLGRLSLKFARSSIYCAPGWCWFPKEILGSGPVSLRLPSSYPY